MKKLLLLLCAIQFGFSLTNCTNTKSKRIITYERYDLLEVVMPENDSVLYLRNTMKPVTGIVSMDSLEIGLYKNGLMDGIHKRYTKDRKFLVSECEFKDGNPVGVLRTWYDTGQLQTELNYENGMLNGLAKQWNEDGQLVIKATFKNDELNGELLEWDEDGRKTCHTNLRKGQLKGDCYLEQDGGYDKFFVNSKGEIDRHFEHLEEGWKVSVNLKNGKLHGTSKMSMSTVDGEVTVEEVFSNHEPVDGVDDLKFKDLYETGLPESYNTVSNNAFMISLYMNLHKHAGFNQVFKN